MPISDSNKSYFDDQIANADILNNSGTQGALTVGITPIEVKVGVSPLEGRKVVTVFNNSNRTIYWGYTSGVTALTGTPIERDQLAVFEVGDSLPIYLVASTGSNNVRITEAG
jgi:hypothetical protein